MHLERQFFVYWALAFLTLCAGLALLNLYYDRINHDLMLRSHRQEAAIAVLASLIQGAAIWVVVCFIREAEALIAPELVVAFIYKASHFRDWCRYDVILLLAFQAAVGWTAGYLFLGWLLPVILMWIVFGGILAVIAYVHHTT